MILLDTHIWLRWLTPGETPLPSAMTRMLDQADDLAVSAVSCWEVAYLHKRGAAGLADVHRDPADRFIIATALASRRRPLTLDAAITKYPELVGQLVTV